MSGIVDGSAGARAHNLGRRARVWVPVGPSLAEGRSKRSTQGKAPTLPYDEAPKQAPAAPRARAEPTPKAAAPESRVESTSNLPSVDKSVVEALRKELADVKLQLAASEGAAELEAAATAGELAGVKQKLVEKVEENQELSESLARVKGERDQAQGDARESARLLTEAREEVKTVQGVLAELKQHAAGAAEAAEALLESRVAQAKAAATLEAHKEAQAQLREIKEQYARATSAVHDECNALKKRLSEAETAAAAGWRRVTEQGSSTAPPPPPRAPAPAPALAPVAPARVATAAPPARQPTAPKKRSRSKAAAGAAEGRAKNADAPLEVAPEKLVAFAWTDPLFENAPSAEVLTNRYTTWVVNKQCLYYEDEKVPVKQQCRWHVAYFLRLLSLNTGKWAPGNVKEMCTYLLGSRDITGTKEKGGIFNRKFQIANWLWPRLIPDYAAFTSQDAPNKKVFTLAHKHMTATRALWAMYEWFVEQKKPMPVGWQEGDPVPARKAKRTREGEAEAEAEDAEDGLEEPVATARPKPLGKRQHEVLVQARAAARAAKQLRLEAASAAAQAGAEPEAPAEAEADATCDAVAHVADEQTAAAVGALFASAGQGGGD